MQRTKILFLLKRREDYNHTKHTTNGLSTGLFNSASFVADELTKHNIESKVSVIVDNDGIDREVSLYKPTHVIIEALWVVPSKFEIITRLHPNVKWIIRLHSSTPFIANEGMAIDWIGDYVSYQNVKIAVNALDILEEIRFFIQTKLAISYEEVCDKVIYLPNTYKSDFVLKPKPIDRRKTHINIGCFGAIRPFKNHLIQAIAALQFAEKHNKILHFHINIGRVEMKGEPVLKNLIKLFEHLENTGHALHIHEWSDHKNFLELCSSMHIGMQVSFSETFNIVAADLISVGTPIVCSKQIPWSASISHCCPTDSDSIVKALEVAYLVPHLNVSSNQKALCEYLKESAKSWVDYFNPQEEIFEDCFCKIKKWLLKYFN